MSWRATAIVKGIGRETGINRSEKLLLLILADYHNEETGQCDPSQSRLANDAIMSRRTVQTALYALEAKGFIKIEDRRGTGVGLNTCQYWLTCLNDIDQGGAKTAQGLRSQRSQGVAQPRDRKGSAVAGAQPLAQPEDRSNRKVEPQQNRNVEPSARAPRAKKVGDQGAAPADLQAYLRKLRGA